MKTILGITIGLLLASCGMNNTEEQVKQPGEPEKVEESIQEEDEEMEESGTEVRERTMEESILDLYQYFEEVDQYEELFYIEARPDFGVESYFDRANQRKAVKQMGSINEYIYPAEEGGQHRYVDAMQEYIRWHNLELGFDGTYDSQLAEATERVNNRYLLIKEDTTFDTAPIYKDRIPTVDQLENIEQVNDTTIRADLSADYIERYEIGSYYFEKYEEITRVAYVVEADTENNILTLKISYVVVDGVTDEDIGDPLFSIDDVETFILRDTDVELPPEESMEFLTEEAFEMIVQEIGLP